MPSDDDMLCLREALRMQKPKEAGEKPVSDQWIPPFVIVDDDDKPVGSIEASGLLPVQI